MKTVLRQLCLVIAILNQIVWCVPGAVYGILIYCGYSPHWTVICVIPGVIFGLWEVWESIDIEGPSLGVFQDKLLEPLNLYLWAFHRYTIA